MSDFLKKQPSKNEKMFYELAMELQMLDRRTLTNSAHIVALGMLLNVEPEKVAQLLANGGDKIEEYGKKINAEMDRLHKEKGIHDHSHTNDNHNNIPKVFFTKVICQHSNYACSF